MFRVTFFLLTIIVSVYSDKNLESPYENLVQKKYEPTWESLDARPLPKWYDEAKIGIFIHWGVFSVPSFGSEWFWINWKNNESQIVDFMEKNYPPKFTYQDFGPQFTAEFFDAKKWASLFDLSGARYIVLTSKHHEGYTLWPSKYSFSWNSKDVGPHRDLIGELATAIRENTDIRFGLYHSLFEWYHPLYLSDKAHLFLQRNFSEGKVLPEMKELIMKYRPEVFWSDGDWEAPNEYWRSKEFLAWLYNESPVKETVVVNDRWGIATPCHHGDFYTCSDRYNPGVLQTHKWENAMTLDTESWGYRRNADLEDYMSIEKLIRTLAETISCGGNLNINIGPTKEGTIAPIFQERLTQLGVWLGYNGEAIYNSVPWKHQNDSLADAWFTSRPPAVYAVFLSWPRDNVLALGSAAELFRSRHCQVSLLGWQGPGELRWTVAGDRVDVQLPDLSQVTVRWGWVLKIKN